MKYGYLQAILEQNRIFIKSLKGKDGDNGVSPIISLERIEDDVIISVTDATGEPDTATVYDGDDDVNWVDIIDKPFTGIDTKYLSIDEYSNLTLPSDVFDNINKNIDDINKELENINADIINDESNSIATTWSSSKIQEELNKKVQSSIEEHTHDILEKFTIDASNNLEFDSKSVMTADKYDSDSDGKIDSAKTADTLDGLLTSISELNYLIGARNNIQSQIDALIAGVNFKGEFSSFVDMQSNITTPEKGDWVYILVDETKDQSNTQYVYDSSNWVYGGGKSSINDAKSDIKGIIQLAGDLTGTASSPQLIEVGTAKTIGYVKNITIDKNGRVRNIIEDDTLEKRIADLESRPQIYVSSTQPTNLKDGDIWIED